MKNDSHNTPHDSDFEQLVAANSKVIYKVCTMYASPEWPVADLYQETVVNLWRGWPRFRGEASHSTWIYRVALNSCISCLRTQSRRPRGVPIEGMVNLFADPAATADPPGEQIEQLYTLIQQLTAFEKAIILLWLEEKSQKQIAAITGLTPGNVAVRLTRIREKLKRMSDL